MKKDTLALREMTSHNNLHTLLFQATSAEYIALCVQTYQLARHAALERLNEGTYRNPAIVLDLDETILDNSAYQKWQIEEGYNFHEQTSWRAWCERGEAGAVPGAVEFVLFAQRKGIEPIFVTSRENVTRHGTAENLGKLGLFSPEELESELKYDPTEEGAGEHAYNTRLFMKDMPNVPLFGGTETFDLEHKFHQRVFLERHRKYEILLSIGDNLGDYAEYYGRVFDEKGDKIPGKHPSVESRRSSAWQDVRLFGREFILLPNATYGGWLNALERNNIGTGDEIAGTDRQVRGPLHEPQNLFEYDNGKQAQPLGTKLRAIPGNFIYPLS